MVVNYRRDDEAAQETVAEIEAAGGTALAIQADVADTDVVESLVQQTRRALRTASTWSWPTPQRVPSSRSRRSTVAHVRRR